MRFESGPVGAQSVEVRVSDTPVDGAQPANTLLTSTDSSEVCGGAGSTVDGVATMDVCCSLKVLRDIQFLFEMLFPGAVCDSSGHRLN